jgi:broad specificity phosphatase PhoE
MSILTLVRHGQAAAFTAHSDRLTGLGRLQVTHLADYWRGRNVIFDEVICGSLRRQVETAEILTNRSIRQAEQFNEYNAGAILKFMAPLLMKHDEQFARLWRQWEQASGSPDQNRHFQRMFEVLLRHWALESITHAEVESWRSFHERVTRGLRGILDDGRSNRRVLVCTSGGPIGVAVQTALEAPPAAALEVNWRVRNASITEFLFSRDRLSLDLFNATPHLEPPLITFR